jgi:crotonobetainyl-CoA:carnitine CoA-transferase CaiB-like acyl-CoA transferase
MTRLVLKRPTRRMMSEIAEAYPGMDTDALRIEGGGDLPSVFSVTDLAATSVAAAGLAAAALLQSGDGRVRPVRVDSRLASMWFASSIRPDGWAPPPPWDPIAGDYPCADGWIRLHTNAPHHRKAALAALDTPEEKDAVAAAVKKWDGDRLESAIVEAGGCAARMQTVTEWAKGEAGAGVAAEPLVTWETIGTASSTAQAMDPARPLAGIRVLDLTRVLAGPVATRFLAGLDADVLRIDPPDWDEPGVVPEVMAGKRSARLDLRGNADRQRFENLLRGADVLIHGYRNGALAGLGYGEAERAALNPGLIDVALDAYGWTGPWRDRRGFDSLVQMSCGIAEAGMRLSGRDRPTPLPVQALDHATGYLMAAAAIHALSERRRTGRLLRARLSLAATAALLTRYPQDTGDPLAAETEADLGPETEQTGWGPAKRLKPPLDIEGVNLVFPLPAMPLGAHDAEWLERRA